MDRIEYLKNKYQNKQKHFQNWSHESSGWKGPLKFQGGWLIKTRTVIDKTTTSKPRDTTGEVYSIKENKKILKIF